MTSSPSPSWWTESPKVPAQPNRPKLVVAGNTGRLTLPKADAFKSIKVDGETIAVRGIAYAGGGDGFQVALIGPDAQQARLAVKQMFSTPFDERAERQVVIVPEFKFRELLKLAGIVPVEASE